MGHSSVKRRSFVGGLAAAGLGACGGAGEERGGGERPRETFRWNMVTSWPPGLPALGTGAENLARRIERASGGRLRIRVYAGNELVPALEVFDAVSRGTAQMGHDASYYHRGKLPAAQYFTAIPFGLNALETNAWLYYGGGLKLWRELYAEHNLVPFPAGQTGVQMAGWFNKAIRSVDDLRGLRIRIPGVGGEVLQRAGAVQVSMPASEVFTSLQTGAIDAADWVGPYNDLALGLHRAARYYYYPGWQEPGPLIECLVNRQAWESLPEDLQEIVATACQAACLDVQAEFTYGNAAALERLAAEPGIEIRALPDDVLALLRRLSSEVLGELAARDDWAGRIHESYFAFLEKSDANQRISEQAFLDARAPASPASGGS